MRLAEQRLWDSLKRNAGKRLWLQRVENVAGVGMPDVYCVSKDLSQCWIELKAPSRPKRETTRLLGNAGLSKEQIAWHLRATTFGLATFILIRDDQHNIFLIPGSLAASINELPAAKLQEESFASDWSEVIMAISKQ